jgi:hypothetical protein
MPPHSVSMQAVYHASVAGNATLTENQRRQKMQVSQETQQSTTIEWRTGQQCSDRAAHCRLLHWCAAIRFSQFLPVRSLSRCPGNAGIVSNWAMAAVLETRRHEPSRSAIPQRVDRARWLAGRRHAALRASCSRRLFGALCQQTVCRCGWVTTRQTVPRQERRLLSCGRVNTELRGYRGRNEWK